MLTIVDAFTRECLTIQIARKLTAVDRINLLSDLFLLRGVPLPIRSDTEPEVIAKSVQAWIAPGSP